VVGLLLAGGASLAVLVSLASCQADLIELGAREYEVKVSREIAEDNRKQAERAEDSRMEADKELAELRGRVSKQSKELMAIQIELQSQIESNTEAECPEKDEWERLRLCLYPW